ncbi:glycosyltransferase family 2 protein [Candidatus Dojkabacteria bacterium]|nr:glycosyltransferase family 2 protein [Candidatus Dojkabacteria bacterium]
MNSSSKNPRVLLILVNYNGLKLLKKHLPSVVRTDYDMLDRVVVDNNSVDESVSFLKENYPNVKVLCSNSNMGYGRAINLAVSQCPGYQYYACLNNDMDVDSRWISELVSTAEKDKRIAIVGPKILHSSLADRGLINSAGMVIDRYYRGFDRFDHEKDTERLDRIEEVDCLCGGALLIRAEAFKDIGGFSKDIFFYYEDVDFCLRLKEAGWKIIYDGSAVVWHDHMATSGSWGSFKRNLYNNINRVKSIKNRIGLLPAVAEFIRFSLEWVWCKVTGKDYLSFITKDVKSKMYGKK